MASAKIITGDDIAQPVTLKKGGLLFVISPTATVKARLVATDHESTYSNEVAQFKSAPGADWENSRIVVQFAPGDTEAITYQGKAKLEIQVEDPGKKTWFADVQIIRGNIA